MKIGFSVPVDALAPMELRLLPRVGLHRGAELPAAHADEDIGIHFTSPILGVKSVFLFLLNIFLNTFCAVSEMILILFYTFCSVSEMILANDGIHLNI